MSTKSIKYWPAAAYLFLGAATLLYLTPDLVTQGIDLDGVVYATVAIASSAVHAGFFEPSHFVEGVTFTDHPPLGIWLEQQWLQLIGTGFYAEKVLGVVLLGVTCLTTAAVWRSATRDDRHRAGGWLPVSLLLAMPLTTSVAKNGYLENPLTVVTTFAVLVAWRRTYLYAVGVGIAVTAAIMIKGPVGAFPLAVPALVAGIVDRNVVRGCLLSVVASVTAASLLGLILLAPQAQAFATAYVESQLYASLAGMREIDHGRGYQLGQIARNLGVAALLAFLLSRLLLVRRRPERTVTMAFAAITAVATLPVLVSPRQYSNYIAQGLPFAALTAAHWLGTGRWRWRLSSQTLAITAGSLLVCSIAIAQMRFGAIGRSVAQIQAANAIHAVMRAGDSLGACPSAAGAYRTMAYAYRMHRHKTKIGGWEQAEYVLCRAPVPGRRRILTLHEGLGLWWKAE